MKKSVKTIFALLLSLALILCAALPVFAAREVKVTLDIAGENGKIYVRLTAPANSDISTISAAIKFDTAKLAYDSVSYITDDTIVSYTEAAQSAEGIVKANLVIADSLTSESKMFTYVFNLADSAEGDLVFSFENIEATDSADQPVNIVFDKAATMSISDLQPLTPDVVQPEFNAPTSEEPSSSEAEESTTDNTGDDSEALPNTSVKIIAAGTAVGIVMLAAVIVFVVYSQKKRKTAE